MSVTRRSFLTAAGALGLTGGLTGGLAGCSGKPAELSLWYWPGGLSDDVVKQVAAGYADRAAVSPTVVGGDFRQRLTTTLATGTSVPDITGVKGEDMPTFLTRADSFLDLNPLGADKLAGSFVAAKYKQATTPAGKQIGLPIDLGPTTLFLRADLWAKAGLPTEHAAVNALAGTWDGWFEVATRLKRAHRGSFAIRNSTDVMWVALAQQPETFVTRSGDFAGDRGGVRRAWDLALRSISAELQAGIYDEAAYNSALSAGTLTGTIGPAWMGLDIETGAPDTSGNWRVAPCPGGPANIGGSFLTLPKGCRDPELAFSFISALLSPANEGRGFTDASLFPAVTAAYALPALTGGQKFYGGQATIDVLGPSAEQLPLVYDDPVNAAATAPYFTELANVEGGKSPATAWRDAVAAGRQAAEQAASA